MPNNKDLVFGDKIMSDKLEQIELQEFIKTTIAEIEAGIEIGKRFLKDYIEFEISISKTEKLGGNVKVYVASGGKEINKESIAKIKFQVYPHYPSNKTLKTDDLPGEGDYEY